VIRYLLVQICVFYHDNCLGVRTVLRLFSFTRANIFRPARNAMLLRTFESYLYDAACQIGSLDCPFLCSKCWFCWQGYIVMWHGYLDDTVLCTNR
jgi:hypothetical protein